MSFVRWGDNIKSDCPDGSPWYIYETSEAPGLSRWEVDTYMPVCIWYRGEPASYDPDSHPKIYVVAGDLWKWHMNPEKIQRKFRCTDEAVNDLVRMLKDVEASYEKNINWKRDNLPSYHKDSFMSVDELRDEDEHEDALGHFVILAKSLNDGFQKAKIGKSTELVTESWHPVFYREYNDSFECNYQEHYDATVFMGREIVNAALSELLDDIASGDSHEQEYKIVPFSAVFKCMERKDPHRPRGFVIYDDEFHQKRLKRKDMSSKWSRKNYWPKVREELSKSTTDKTSEA